jgi:hypothetical protein
MTTLKYTKTKIVMVKRFLLLVVCVGYFFNTFSQEVLTNGDMEDATGWTVYYGSTSHATHQFNYTTVIPFYGDSGCLRVTSTANTNTLFWQQLTLTAGKKYIVDGAVKTNNVTSFFCEFYLSTIAPVNGVDYSPNSNGDVILGLSTWAGCGPNLDGKMSINACTGKRSFVCPGTAGNAVTVYFAFKTGTFSTSFTEVLIDEVSVKEINDSKLISTEYGVLNQDSLTISEVSPLINAEKFRNGLNGYANSTIDITRPGGATIALTDLDAFNVSDTLRVKVTGSLGSSVYRIVTRTLSGDTTVLSTTLGILDNDTNKITELPLNTMVVQLKSALTLPLNATLRILNASNIQLASDSIIKDGYKLEVTAENGTKGFYILYLGSDTIDTETYTDYKTIIAGLTNKIWDLYGRTEIKITKAENPLSGSIINLNGEDIWLYFDSIKPQDLSDKYLAHIRVNGSAAVNLSNIRLVRYTNGSVIISQPSGYKPLTIYSRDSLAGASMELGSYTYNRAAELGVFNDSIRSFRLKRGYMATFAMNELGTGYSKVYIAQDSDLVINTLPAGLYDKVSFVRVIPWRWVTKKGWCGTGDSGPLMAVEALNGTWRYNWDNGSFSTNNIEYVPIRQNGGWPPYENIDNKQNSTHALGFNEPDRPDQANMTVAQMIAAWPNLLKSGLRLGSPAPSDGGLNLLYQFLDSCDKINYRVDFVAMHWYLGCQSARQFYDRLKIVHDRTKRPIWITEWNNGANWTTGCSDPTYEEQAFKIGQFLYMLDTTSFVERYAIYNWVEDVRFMFYNQTNILTPAGKVYRDKVSPKAYNPAKAFSIAYKPQPLAVINPRPVDNSLSVRLDTILRWDNPNVEAPVLYYKVNFGTTNPPPYIGTTTNTYYVPSTMAGSKMYYWKITAVTAYGEKASSVWKFFTETANSINNAKKDIVNIFPNPVNDNLYIAGLRKAEIIDIYNLLGEKVYSGKIQSAVNVSFLKDGIYILKIKGYNPMRFIKE